MVGVVGMGVMLGVTGALGVAVTTITFCPGSIQAIATKTSAITNRSR